RTVPERVCQAETVFLRVACRWCRRVARREHSGGGPSPDRFGQRSTGGNTHRPTEGKSPEPCPQLTANCRMHKVSSHKVTEYVRDGIHCDAARNRLALRRAAGLIADQQVRPAA